MNPQIAKIVKKDNPQIAQIKKDMPGAAGPLPIPAHAMNGCRSSVALRAYRGNMKDAGGTPNGMKLSLLYAICNIVEYTRAPLYPIASDRT